MQLSLALLVLNGAVDCIISTFKLLDASDVACPGTTFGEHLHALKILRSHGRPCESSAMLYAAARFILGLLTVVTAKRLTRPERLSLCSLLATFHAAAAVVSFNDTIAAEVRTLGLYGHALLGSCLAAAAVLGIGSSLWDFASRRWWLTLVSQRHERSE